MKKVNSMSRSQYERTPNKLASKHAFIHSVNDQQLVTAASIHCDQQLQPSQLNCSKSESLLGCSTSVESLLLFDL